MQNLWDPQAFTTGARALGRDETTIRAAKAAAEAIRRRDPELPIILTRSHLAHLSGVPAKALRLYATREGTRYQDPPPYRVFRLKKRAKPGGRAPERPYRTICVPEPGLMRLQRWINQQILSRAPPHAASFAYFGGRGLLPAAKRHAGCRWLIKMDIRDFFESITERQVYKVFRRLGYGALVSFELARICTRVRKEDPARPTGPYALQAYSFEREGRLPQGAPTSPGLANLAMHDLDEHLTGVARRLGWTYTRYADDLAFSTRRTDVRRVDALEIIGQVKGALQRAGLDPNDSKTVIAPPGARRLVLGLQVDGPAPRLSRDFRTNLETHLYALGADHLGPERHRRARGFASLIGMRRHILGLLAFAHAIEPTYAAARYAQFNAVDWPL